MIRFDSVSKRYPGRVDALSRVSFELAEGEIAFLTGRSGAGKSTLMKLIILLERASEANPGAADLRAVRRPRTSISGVEGAIGVNSSTDPKFEVAVVRTRREPSRTDLEGRS